MLQQQVLGLTLHCVMSSIALLLIVAAQSQDIEASGEQALSSSPGQYVPGFYGADRGKYTADYRGRYQHIHMPYDGGYGDRGLKYEHDRRGYFQHPFSLGPRDHLRFMIDFNYNGSGWQVILFEWIRDGDEDRHFNYVNENKLWEEPQAPGRDIGIGGTTPTGTDGSTNVQVDGEYVPNQKNIDSSQGSAQNIQDVAEIQGALRTILEYIQAYILPKLN